MFTTVSVIIHIVTVTINVIINVHDATIDR